MSLESFDQFGMGAGDGSSHRRDEYLGLNRHRRLAHVSYRHIFDVMQGNEAEYFLAATEGGLIVWITLAD